MSDYRINLVLALLLHIAAQDASSPTMVIVGVGLAIALAILTAFAIVTKWTRERDHE